MKMQMVAVLASLFLGHAVSAQTISMPQEGVQEQLPASRGLRVTLIKPFFETSFERQAPMRRSERLSETNGEESFGLGLGYANLPVREVGYTVNAAYYRLGNDLDADGLVRVDGNFGWAFTRRLNIKGGANISQFTEGNAQNLKIGVGAQASIGYQFSRNIGLDAGFAYMTQGGNYKGTRDIGRVSGAEVGITGTF